MILLDTHVFVWLASAPGNLSRKAVALIRANAGDLCLSAVSAWEISLLAKKGRLRLPASPEEYVADALDHLRIREVPLTRKTVQYSVALPPVHNDPFDRVLIAESILNGWTLVSSDQVMPKYPGLRLVW